MGEESKLGSKEEKRGSRCFTGLKVARWCAPSAGLGRSSRDGSAQLGQSALCVRGELHPPPSPETSTNPSGNSSPTSVTIPNLSRDDSLLKTTKVGRKVPHRPPPHTDESLCLPQKSLPRRVRTPSSTGTTEPGYWRYPRLQGGPLEYPLHSVSSTKGEPWGRVFPHQSP